MIKTLEEAFISLKEGDIEALNFIYKETHKGVFMFVLPILEDYHLAEDITEQTFVSVYEKARQYVSNNPKNWILTIAKNLALNELEKRKREKTVDFQDPTNSNLVYTNAPSDIDTPIIDLANKVLSPTDFQIVMMHVIGEYHHREIAEALDIPLGTVTWKYNQALSKLKKELEKQKYERQ